MSTDYIRQLAEQNWEYTVKIRRQIHKNPELSMREYETAALIRAELDKMGIAWKPAGETGTYGILPATEPGGATVALRADIDALPVCENTGLPFSSQNEGVMHACGHDCHAAMLLGGAKVLSALKHRPNSVVFVFQPAEEFALGARQMIEHGALEGVDVIYGSHVWPDIPAGKIGLRDGGFMAGADKFTVRISGKGGHGSQPENCCDPIPACTSIADAIHQIKGLSLRGDTPLALTVGYIRCGSAMNIIPDSGEVSGSIRWFDRATQNKVRVRIKELADGSCAMYGCRAEVEVVELCPCTSNDPLCAAQARKALSALYGEDAALTDFPLALGGEDFSFYGQVIPSVFGLIGCGNGEKTVSLHNPHFTVDEKILEMGVALYAKFACDYRK